jgi:hypothetical protein
VRPLIALAAVVGVGLIAWGFAWVRGIFRF